MDESSLIDLPIPSSPLQGEGNDKNLHPRLRTLLESLQQTQADLDRAKRALELSSSRLQLLSLASRRADGLAPVIVVEAMTTAPRKGSKKKTDGGGGPKEDRVCGFDERLIEGGKSWEMVVEGGKGVWWDVDDDDQRQVGEEQFVRYCGDEKSRSFRANDDRAKDEAMDQDQKEGRGGDDAGESRSWWCGLARKKCDGHIGFVQFGPFLSLCLCLSKRADVTYNFLSCFNLSFSPLLFRLLIIATRICLNCLSSWHKNTRPRELFSQLAKTPTLGFSTRTSPPPAKSLHAD